MHLWFLLLHASQTTCFHSSFKIVNISSYALCVISIQSYWLCFLLLLLLLSLSYLFMYLLVPSFQMKMPPWLYRHTNPSFYLNFCVPVNTMFKMPREKSSSITLINRHTRRYFHLSLVNPYEMSSMREFYSFHLIARLKVNSMSYCSVSAGGMLIPSHSMSSSMHLIWPSSYLPWHLRCRRTAWSQSSTRPMSPGVTLNHSAPMTRRKSSLSLKKLFLVTSPTFMSSIAVTSLVWPLKW